MALRASPNNVDVMTGLAESQLLLGHAADAVTLLERAETLDPRSLSTIAELSESYRNAGRTNAPPKRLTAGSASIQRGKYCSQN